MRRFVLTVVTALAVLPGSLLAQETRSAEDVQRDLVLRAELTTKNTIVPGEPVRVAATIENRSKTVTYPVVAPGDGSMVGWREPHVFYTAEVDTGDGEWKPIEKVGLGRCGNFDANWQDDVMVLRPGGRLELKDWLTAPHYFLDFQAAGRVRLQVHYRFTAGQVGKGRETLEGAAPQGLGGMVGVEAFELVSAPVELTVVRPFEIELTARGDVRAGRDVRVSTVVDALLVNAQAENVRVDPRQGHVSVRVRQHSNVAGRNSLDARSDARIVTLAQHEHVALFGEGPYAAGRDEELRFKHPGTVELAIEYTGATGVPRLRSKWISLRVVK